MKSDFIIKKSTNGNKIELCAYLGKDSIVKVPTGITKISSNSFADYETPNDFIKTIILPDSVVEIDSNAFAYCTALNKIIWPSNEKFKILDVDLFKGCISLQKISLPESISYITTFIMPSNLTEIQLGSNINFVSQYAFTYSERKYDEEIFDNTNTINILLKNDNYKIINGFMINVKHKIALFYVERNKTIVEVPNFVNIIASHCFDEMEYFSRGFSNNKYFHSKIVPIEKVIIPTSVSIIDPEAFSYCNKLEAIVYKGKSSDVDIAHDAFVHCDLLDNQEFKIVCCDTELYLKHKQTTNMMLERIVYIHQEIKKGGYPCTNKLRDLCRSRFGSGKLSTSTISRDIDFLRNRFNAPIEYDSSRKGYYYSKEFELKF